MSFIACVRRNRGNDFNVEVLHPFLHRIQNDWQEELKALKGWWLIFTGSSVTFWSENPQELGHTWDHKGPGHSNVDIGVCFDWDQPCDKDDLHQHLTQILVVRPQQGKRAHGTRQVANQSRIAAWAKFRMHWERVLGRFRKERSSSTFSFWDVVVYAALGNRF